MPDAEALLDTVADGKALAAEDAMTLAEALTPASGARVYPASFAAAGGKVIAAARSEGGRVVLLASKGDAASASGRLGAYAVRERVWTFEELHSLQGELAFLAPSGLGKATSAGLGDRLGSATVGHARAARGKGIAPVFAQQSIREMTRTHRSPQDVVTDAAWGVLASGWRGAWGADADHLKSTDDVDRCAAAGFVMYTIDPGEHVDDRADARSGGDLDAALEALPWDALETTLSECRARHVRASDGDAPFARAAVKYGRAVAHTVGIARHVASRLAPAPFEIEVSVDETATPTSPFEHRFVATELARMGVVPASLAVRFVGEIEKGIDYKGDLGRFRREAESHAAVARELGGYKLSVHSGSDKFSVYPILAEAARGAVHLKTAGTSYLEALRAVAEADIDLFREIAAVARARYDDDRRTYHVSGSASDVPEPGAISLESAGALLDHVGARQVFHVTYGSVLDAPASGGGTLGDALRRCLDANEELHWGMVGRHIERHLAPFARTR
ncbi:MAG: tagaturonate epimerase family protein [Planctomycetota bacterium]|jgi:hypothetical protein